MKQRKENGEDGETGRRAGRIAMAEVKCSFVSCYQTSDRMLRRLFNRHIFQPFCLNSLSFSSLNAYIFFTSDNRGGN